MRILLGIACLVLVFGLSTLWHRSEMDSFRADSPIGTEQVVQAAPVRQHRPGWGEVIVGSPSGAEPIFIEPTRAPAPAVRLKPPGERRSNESRASAPASNPSETNALIANRQFEEAPADWELIVGSGDVLSRIVRVQYGRVSPELEQRLAEYNGLSSPDKLKVGQTLYLPTEARLLGDSE